MRHILTLAALTLITLFASVGSQADVAAPDAEAKIDAFSHSCTTGIIINGLSTCIFYCDGSGSMTATGNGHGWMDCGSDTGVCNLYPLAYPLSCGYNRSHSGWSTCYFRGTAGYSQCNF